MNSSPLTPFGEHSLTLVAGVFDDPDRAEQVAESLRHDPGLHTTVIHPGDEQVSRKLEPEQRGIWRTLLRSHALLMPAGALLGLVVALWLVAAGWPAAAGSPYFTLLFLGLMGAFFGGMVAGLLTLRPDHAIVIRRVRAALARGRHAVVVHPLNEMRARAAMAALQRAGVMPLRSL
ncbi:hypothetical protein [Azohydromonas caseinilytica]|uniref:Riboflavin biosynthesis protein RibA n=1 Tax=Azohydromonas caseinilytica TaxID=2728836 RepID=A0A848FID5_9BURK|nr:hypothetical protein [Azohydromonas caseinilytica]NML17601.1 hypothetical protein [Azohydromonas caseinilytica]